MIVLHSLPILVLSLLEAPLKHLRGLCAPPLESALELIEGGRRDEDIDPGLTQGAPRVQLLRALAQNTHEQALLAVLAYVAWAVLMPIGTLSVVGLAAIVFVLGRILFFIGYARGAPARSLGFTACFYPTALMLLTVAAVVGSRLPFG